MAHNMDNSTACFAVGGFALVGAFVLYPYVTKTLVDYGLLGLLGVLGLICIVVGFSLIHKAKN